MALFGGVDSVHSQLTLDASVVESDHWNLACCGGEAVWNKTEPCAGSVPFLPPTDPAPTMNHNETDDSPANAAEHGDEEAWSGDEDASDNDGADTSGKRKRQRLSRPLSVSCELCKSRKVGLLFHL